MKQTAFIVDLDGTIMDGSHRIHLIPPIELASNARSWDAFNNACFDDTPMRDTIEMINAMVSAGHKALFVTGRNECAYKQTVKWLEKHIEWFDIENDEVLLMRDLNDHCKPIDVKIHKIQVLAEQYDILFAIDDDHAIVEQIRKLGIPAWHVRNWQECQ